MLSKNIKKLRTEKGMTQKELAEKLHVTPQAVSRWENGEVEPSVSTIGEMADIFGVTADEIIGGERLAKQEVAATAALAGETAVAGADAEGGAEKSSGLEIPPFVYGICRKCGTTIVDAGDFVRETNLSDGHVYEKIYCKKCAKEEAERAEQEKKDRIVGIAALQRKRSFLWGGLIAAFAAAVAVVCTVKYEGADKVWIALLGGVALFTFVSCLFLKNNFIEDLFIEIASWGFVKFPGLIFSFDLDGIAWLIGMKLLFAVLGFLIGFALVCLALVVCMAMSLIVYPFALSRSIRKPEKTEIL